MVGEARASVFAYPKNLTYQSSSSSALKARLTNAWLGNRRSPAQQHAAVEADVGEGKLYLFGPEVLYRGQPHRTFQLVFNGIHLSTAEKVSLSEALIP